MKVELPHDSTGSPEYTLRLDINQQNIESLRNLPLMQDHSAIRVMEVLTIIIPPIYIVQPQLFPIVVAKMVDLCLRLAIVPCLPMLMLSMDCYSALQAISTQDINWAN
ncbi:MAG: hypothetical protein HC930_08190 [Hydrococcus sp. SU_1_0]|nr:hypothetical protein [Hydrococcus sp. SU_1_0]